MNRLKELLTFSNVVALAALFFALGGTVYAAGQINGAQIKPKSIPGNRIKPKSISTTQLKAGSVTSAKIKAGSVSGTQIKSGSISGTQIKSGSISGTQIKAGSLTGTQVVGSTLKGVTANLAAVQYVSVPVAIVKEALAGSSATAGCPLGQKVIGGGAIVSNENYAYVNDSGPSADRNGWFATGYSSFAGMTMTVTAICTTVTTPLG
jgi:hypothetical protein